MTEAEQVTANEAQRLARQWEGSTFVLVTRLLNTVMALHTEANDLRAQLAALTERADLMQGAYEAKWAAQDRATKAEAERDRLVEQRDAALALHHLVVVGGSDGVDYPICDGEEQTWPCETARALGASDA